MFENNAQFGDDEEPPAREGAAAPNASSPQQQQQSQDPQQPTNAAPRKIDKSRPVTTAAEFWERLGI